jgi:O-antigen ligase
MKTDKKQKKYGVFFGLLFVICHAIADYFSTGSVFKAFTSNKKAEAAFESSATVTLFKRGYTKIRPVIESVRKFISRQFENSLILKAFFSVTSKLMRMPGRNLGAFMMTWGAYVVGIALIKYFLLSVNADISADALCGTVVLLASIPLLMTDKPICTLCAESPIVFSVLTKIFGVPPEAMRMHGETKSGQSIAVIFGIVFGILTYLVSPIDMVLGLIALISVVLILVYPEGGVLISIAVAPFLGLTFAPSRILAALVLFTAIAYGVKVIRGKRVLSFGITDLAFTAFWFAVLLAGFAPGESNTFEHAILCCALMLIFPLTVNLMKYRRWIKACAFAFILPTVIVAFIGIAQYSLGLSPSGWLDESIFGEISSRTVSLFNNPNILGVYLTMLFPFVLTLTLPHNQSKMRVLGCILSAFVAVCTVFTFSRSAWIALIAGGMLFAITISPKGVLWMIPAAATVLGTALIFPDTVGVRLKNFITMADPANNYRVSVWNSSLNMLCDVLAGGIGMGEEAFKTAYIGYASAGTQYAMHSHSLYMQIAIQTGLAGLILFAAFVFNSTRKCCSSLANKSSDDLLSSVTKAAVSGACALLAAGLFDYTWYNYRVFFMFWALIGFACAAAKLNDRSLSETYIGSEEESHASVTIPIQKRSQKVTLSEVEKEVMNNDGREED